MIHYTSADMDVNVLHPPKQHEIFHRFCFKAREWICLPRMMLFGDWRNERKRKKEKEGKGLKKELGGRGGFGAGEGRW